MELENLNILPDLVYTPEQAAERLGVKPRWLQLDRSGKRTLAYIKIGRLVRYRGQDLLKFLDANRVDGGV